MPADLVFEVGTEEIPAGFLARALPELEAQATRRLAEARLDHAGISAVGTPRRLALLIRQLADRQPDLSERVVGPPASVAFGPDGMPTKAAIGFARKNGVDVETLERAEVEGKKGEYAVCTRHEEGRPAAAVLSELLTRLLAELPWPKSMRWGHREESFVRPVHWIVALLGPEVVPVEFAGIRSGAHTRGHRFLGSGELAVEGGPTGYVEALRRAHVIVDPITRRDMIAAELSRIEREVGARVRPDEALLDEVSCLVEYPLAGCGEFDPAFLEVPEEVIVSAMRAHQRYFAMEDAEGVLVNRFVTIAGTITRDVAVVRAGNERVLAARLADARFFFREDRKHDPDELARRLEKVVFQTRLGTIGAKVERVAAGALRLADALGPEAVDAEVVARAAALSKADLVSAMVGEFPDLQGIMGSHYARLAGEPSEVCDAIEQHYLPRGAGDRLPSASAGAVVAIADRVDTLVGGFAAGLAPSGSADPYGLRRAALAVLAILADRGWAVPLSALVAEAAHKLEAQLPVTEAHRAQVLEFFATRLRGMLIERGLPADCVDAALTAGADDVPDALARAEAVSRLRTRPDFEPLATAFKRVANILKGEAPDGEPDPARFVEAEERDLWSSFQEVAARVERRLGDRDYHGALSVLADLKIPVDRFFDKVLVMDPDPAVRANRLALLGRINRTFTRIADFRQLAV
jgi:glycyl-tRNA synthetase beta chain